MPRARAVVGETYDCRRDLGRGPKGAERRGRTRALQCARGRGERLATAESGMATHAWCWGCRLERPRRNCAGQRVCESMDGSV